MIETLRKYSGWGVTLLLLLLLWLWVLPPQLGGRTTFLTTHGISMEPHLHEGDLAMLQKKSKYKVGDVIQYQATTLNVPLLHRIIKIDNEGISTKGDNNNFVDIDHPKPSQINGKLVHVFKGGGKYIGWLKSWPVRLLGAALIGWAIFNLLMGKSKDKNPIKRQNPLPSGRGAKKFNLKMPNLKHLNLKKDNLGITSFMAIFGVLTILSLGITASAFSRPIDSSETRQTIYDFKGKFGYSAHASGGNLVYPDGQLSTGDPIYTAMVKDIFVTYSFEIASPSRYRGAGDIAINMVLKGATGWSRTVPLSTKTEFVGNQGRTSAVLNLGQIQDTVRQIQALTKMNEGSYTIIVEPAIHIKGTLGGAKLESSYNPKLSFKATSTQLLVNKGSGDQTAGPTSSNVNQTMEGLTTNGGGTIDLPPTAPAKLKALGMAIGIASLRMAGLTGTVIGLLGLALCGSKLRRPRVPVERDPHKEVVARCEKIIVPVFDLRAATDSTVLIEVAGLAELARIAEQHAALILHESSEGTETFAVTQGGTTYQYKHTTPLVSARFGVDEAEQEAESVEQ